MSPNHLRVDLELDGSWGQSSHDEECPEIGPICNLRDEPPQQHHTDLVSLQARLFAEVGVRPNLALQAQLPFRLVGTWTRYTDLSGNPITLDYENIHHRDGVRAGLGDVKLATHFGWSAAGLNGGVALGLSLPTGVVHQNPDRLEGLGLPHEHLQFGTGTVDPTLSLDLGKTFSLWSLAAFGSAQVPLYPGDQGYQAGAMLTLGVSASSHLGWKGPLFRLALFGYGETPERWDDQVPLEDGNRGRVDLYLGPGVTFDLGKDWTLSVDARFRLAGLVVGAQLAMPVVLSVSLGTLFHFESADEEEHLHGGGEEVADIADLVTAGEAAPLEPVAGKWTVFDFHAPWCEACKSLDVALRNRARAWTKELAVRRVNIVDFDSPIARHELPGVGVLPRIRVVNPKGQVVFEASGSPDELLQRLDAQLH